MRIMLVLSLAAAACAHAPSTGPLDPAEFRGRPLVGAEVESPLVTHRGEELGLASVGWGGAFRTTLREPRRDVVHVRLTVHNSDVIALAVPIASLVLAAGGQTLAATAAFSDADGAVERLTIPPAQTRVLDVVFQLPGDARLAPGAIDRLSLDWTVVADGERLPQRTTFPASSRGALAHGAGTQR